MSMSTERVCSMLELHAIHLFLLLFVLGRYVEWTRLARKLKSATQLGHEFSFGPSNHRESESDYGMYAGGRTVSPWL
jgi:hypothetical protein